MTKKERKYDLPLIIISLSIVFAIVIALTTFPEKGAEVANNIFSTLTNWFGTATLFFTFGCFLLLIYLAFSKYGNIRLSESKPEYSTFSWVAMMLSAGLGSATVYWALVEWSYYFTNPGLGIAARTDMALEWATTYNLFHWGMSAWGLYCIAALPVAYHFHVRKNKGLSLSAIISKITGKAQDSILGRAVDVIFIFTVFGALSITLGLSIPMVAEGVARIIGIESSFGLNIGIIIAIAIIFSFSSYIGLEKGMKNISSWNTYLAILFVFLVLAVGPTLFIIKNTTNALGLMFQNFVRMSLWTDPISDGGFPEAWTVFYWLYWITYTPFMALFVTKISKGRKIKEVIFNMLISGSFGCWIFFGVLGNYSMSTFINNIVDVPAVISASGGSFAIMEIMGTLPFSKVFIGLFTIISMLFLATTLDSASYTMAATVTPGLKEDEDPSAFQRLFWCFMIAAVPLAMILINAPLNTIKTCAIVTAIPLCFVIGTMIYGMLKWMVEDYGKVPSHEVEMTQVKKVG